MEWSIDLPLNHNKPEIMHIDLNSCFATIEQQANPLLRGKPIAVAAYTSPGGCILAPSIEAKRFGVKTGMRVREGRLLCPALQVMAPDPPKYRAVNLKLREIFRTYSPDVTPKSIDEAVIDFRGTPALKAQSLEEIGTQIKHKIKTEIGEWMSCSVGIGPNRFLAKTAAGLHKPDGLDRIEAGNLRETLNKLELIDLTGINTRYQARLNAGGIFTPLEFLEAPLEKLKQEIFQSVVGYHWYLRLRGWEADALDFSRRSYGQSYALHLASNDPHFLSQIILKLTEKMGRRLRRAGLAAEGIHLALVYEDYTHWHLGRLFETTLYSTKELYQKAIYIFNKQPSPKKVSKIAVSCYSLVKTHQEQFRLFETEQAKDWRLCEALDKINDRFGEYIITPALMLGMQDLVLDRISFGGVKDLE